MYTTAKKLQFVTACVLAGFFLAAQSARADDTPRPLQVADAGQEIPVEISGTLPIADDFSLEMDG